MNLIEELHRGPVLADGAMGSYLFWRTGRLSERNHVYEALNLELPELIREVHLSYLRAGARCLTTNTFSANQAQLAALGEDSRLEAINRTGVELAREAIAQFSESSVGIGSSPCFVLGSIGPSRLADALTRADVEFCYGRQLEVMVEAGVDALLLETFTSVDDLLLLAEVARTRSSVPVIAELALDREPHSQAWRIPPREFIQAAAEAGVAVAGVNCCAPWDAEAFLDEIEGQVPGSMLLSVMPNAGGFQRIGNRFMTRVNPEFMGRFARTLVRRGVRLVGGCCEVHPHHIREMNNYLHGEGAGQRAVEVSAESRDSAGDDLKRLNGRFSARLKAGEFVVSVEILPPRGTSPQVIARKVELVASLHRLGLADAVDFTDGSRGIPLMPAGDFVKVVRDALGWNAESGDGLEFIPHFTCRDLNMMGLQARLVGFHAQRVHNVLFVTGDPPKISPSYPRSTAVFDADSVTMLRLAHRRLNAGLDFGGQPLSRSGDGRTHFTLGTGFEPEALNRERELDKLRAKVEAGADYVMTQPTFDGEPLRILEPFRKRIPILVGVMILTGLDHAQRVGETPGVVIPQAVLDRLGRFVRAEDQAKVGVELAAEQIRWVHQEGWPGLYLMSPGALDPIVEVLSC